jgi:hypothetical protein
MSTRSSSRIAQRAFSEQSAAPASSSAASPRVVRIAQPAPAVRAPAAEIVHKLYFCPHTCRGLQKSLTDSACCLSSNGESWDAHYRDIQLHPNCTSECRGFDVHVSRALHEVHGGAHPVQEHALQLTHLMFEWGTVDDLVRSGQQAQ